MEAIKKIEKNDGDIKESIIIFLKGYDTEYYKDRKKFMKTLCRKAGVDYFRFHPLRHAEASLMANNNVPLGAIQKILGHEIRSTTEIYLHTFEGTERDAISTFERVRRNPHTDSHTEKKST